MTTLLFTLGFFLLMALGMAVGVLAGRKPIQGSCGGISAMTGGDCPVCGGNPAKCEGQEKGQGQEEARGREKGEQARQLAYDATRERR